MIATAAKTHRDDEGPLDELPLDQVQPGLFTCVRIATSSDKSARIEQLGICNGRSLRLLASGNPMIIHVNGTNVGLSRELARFVFVKR